MEEVLTVTLLVGSFLRETKSLCSILAFPADGIWELNQIKWWGKSIHVIVDREVETGMELQLMWKHFQDLHVTTVWSRGGWKKKDLKDKKEKEKPKL